MTAYAEAGSYRRAFSPILFTISGNIGDAYSLTITTASGIHRIKGDMYRPIVKVDISAYIQSLFIKGLQQLPYSVQITGPSLNQSFGPYVAIRSAAQVREAKDLDTDYMRTFLTDFDKIAIWAGYPRSVNFLSEQGDYFEIIKDGVSENIKITTSNMVMRSREFECGDYSIEIHKKINYAASYMSFICQKAGAANTTIAFPTIIRISLIDEGQTVDEPIGQAFLSYPALTIEQLANLAIDDYKNRINAFWDYLKTDKYYGLEPLSDTGEKVDVNMCPPSKNVISSTYQSRVCLRADDTLITSKTWQTFVCQQINQ